MSSIDRPLSGAILRFCLVEERKRVSDPDLLARHGRNARTLVKEGPLRVTLVTLRAGGEMASHHADGPITVHVLEGGIRVLAEKREHPLAVGDLIMVAAGVEHSVASAEGGTFLLTMVQPVG